MAEIVTVNLVYFKLEAKNLLLICKIKFSNVKGKAEIKLINPQYIQLHKRKESMNVFITLTFVLLFFLAFIQPKQRTSLSSSLDVQKPVNHSCDPSEVSSSLGYASFSTSPPASPPLSPNQEDSAGSNDDCQLTGKTPENRLEGGRAISVKGAECRPI